MTDTVQPIALAPCQCGNADPDVVRDTPFPTTYIECPECNRMVGAETVALAFVMWNGAMVALADWEEMT